jgi:hypothetical protein
MKRVIGFLLFMLVTYTAGIILFTIEPPLFPWLEKPRAWVLCGFVGGIGGVTYCLRGVYLTACVSKNWSNDWLPWYFLRPFVSVICGVVSLLFLKAGLIILEAKTETDASRLGFLALAFIAGLNVDKFVTKLEDISKAAWGIEKSRASQIDSGK